MTGRENMGEGADTSLAEITSELFDRVQKMEKTSSIHASSWKPMKKCAMKMKQSS